MPTFAHSRESGNPVRGPRLRGDELLELSGAGRRLAGFARTLRDNGFRVGLAETSDALAVLTSAAAARPASLMPALRALFCATHSDWERFDEIFDAFWCGEGMRQRQILGGHSQASTLAAKKLAEAHVPEEARGLLDRIERRTDGDADVESEGRGRRASGALHARAAGAARTGPPPRPPSRFAPQHSSQRVAWRYADRARLAATQDQAAAARGLARRLGFNESLHGILRALRAWCGRRLS